MAKFPTYEEMSKEVAERALDEFLYMGKSLQEWMQIIASEDAISRQAVLDIAKSSKSNWIDNSVLFKRVNELPPVTPQPKIGHWQLKIDNTNHLVWECDNCKGLQANITNYCPDCGIKMEEVEK